MKLFEIDQVKLTTSASILKIHPKELSFMASLGLGFFESVLKFPKSESSKSSLTLLYQFNQIINESLSASGYQQYIEYFQFLTINLQKFTSIIDYIKAQENECMVYTLYLIFSAVYSHIYKIPLFQSHPTDPITYKAHIEYFCSQLGVSLTIYSSIESFITIGSGLSISLFFDSSEFSLILEFDANINSSQALIEEVFNQMSIPKSLKQFDSIIEIIESFRKQYKRLTPAMENIVNIRKTWTCAHDLKTMKFNCGQKHCFYCLFDSIKFCLPEEAKCRCGYLLTPDEFEKVFKTVQPLFQRCSRCSYCKKKYDTANSIVCEGHYCCINCRSISRKNCVICFRPYTDVEIAKLKQVFQGVEDNEKVEVLEEKHEEVKKVKVKEKSEEVKKVKVMEKYEEAKKVKEKPEFECKVCGRKVRGEERMCKNRCEVCRACWRNIRNCGACGEKTGNAVVVVCSYCKKGKSGQQELTVLKCKHVYHAECSKADRCRQEGN